MYTLLKGFNDNRKKNKQSNFQNIKLNLICDPMKYVPKMRTAYKLMVERNKDFDKIDKY